MAAVRERRAAPPSAFTHVRRRPAAAQAEGPHEDVALIEALKPPVGRHLRHYVAKKEKGGGWTDI